MTHLSLPDGAIESEIESRLARDLEALRIIGLCLFARARKESQTAAATEPTEIYHYTFNV